MIQIQDNISEQKNLKDKLESEQEKLHVEYNKVSNTTRTPEEGSSLLHEVSVLQLFNIAVK